jgi:conjugal transfer/type IV secretion protein DotA/TraY
MSDKPNSRIGKFSRGALSLAFRPANPLAPAMAYVDDLRVNATTAITTLAKGLKPETVDPREEEALSGLTDTSERFRGAMRLYRVNDAQVAEMERGAGIRLVMYFIAFSLSLLFAIVAPRMGLIGRSYLPIMDVLVPWMMSAVLLAKCARTSFHLYQLRRRALVGVREWLRDPSAWLGGPPALMIGLMLMAWVAMSPNSAYAQTAQASAQSIKDFSGWASAMLTNHDLSVQWLTRLFPGAAFMWGGTASTTDDFAPLFALLNGLLFVMASGSLVWFTLLGLVHTAHSGKVLGDRYHQIWAPIRVLVGVTFLFPVKGYCLAQLVALWVIFSGYAVANGIWTTYVANSLSGQSASLTIMPSVAIGRNLAIQVMTSEVCSQVLKQYATGTLFNSSRGAIVSPSPTTSTSTQLVTNSIVPAVALAGTLTGNTTTTKTTATVWDYGTVCGSIRVDSTIPTVLPASSVGSGYSTNMQANLDAYKAFDDTRTAEVTALIKGIQESGLPKLIAQMVVPKSGATPPDISQAPQKINSILTLASTFDTNIITAAKNMSAVLDKKGRANFLTTAKDLGWAGAGAMNASLTRISAAAVDRVQGAMPSVVGPKKDDLGEEVTKIVGNGFLTLASMIRTNDNADFNGRTAVQMREDTQSRNPLGTILKGPMDRLANAVVSAGSLNDLNPMDEMISVGNEAMVAGELIIGSGAVASGGSEVAGSWWASIGTVGVGSFIKGAFEFVAPFLMTIGGSLLFFGALHAYVLPLVAYIIWLFAILGCAAYTVEVVIAAPIAAFMHVRFDGQELVDQPQKAIYQLVFNAAFRPTLLLFGLIASTKIFAVMATYLNTTFAMGMFASQGNNIIGGVGIFTMYMLLMYLHFQLAIKSMALVHQIPAMVSHVLGAPDGERHEREGLGVVVGAVGSFGRNTGAVVASNVMGGGGRKKPPAGDDEKPDGDNKGGTATVAKTVSTGGDE